MRVPTLLVLAIVTAACVRSSGEDALVAARADWQDFITRLPGDPAAAAAALDTYGRRNGLPMSFMLAPDAPEEMVKAFTVNPHPCGESVTAFARAVPASHPVADPDLVVEFDAAGREVRRWSVPADAMVAGVRGDRVLVPPTELGVDLERTPLYLAVATDGSYRVVTGEFREGQPIECPALEPFAGSDYLGCARFTDDAGRERRLAFQFPCT